MSIIGSFTRTANGFTGQIATLTVRAKLRLEAADKPSDAAPDYRVLVGTVEIGAAWTKTARETGEEYFSVKLDDPSFPGAINANLVHAEEDRYNLLWNRPSSK
jgi:uncharacterized protein (DUF736 family)